MTRTARIAVTAADAALDPHAAVAAALRRALPGVWVVIDPVDIEFELTGIDPPGSSVRCSVRWSSPTPEAVARHLYHEHGPVAPYAFDVAVPALPAYLGPGPGGPDAP